MPTDDLRDRVIARLLASWSIADDPASQAMARKAAERDADTMLAVRDGELERLHGELGRLTESRIFWRKFAAKLEAERDERQDERDAAQKLLTAASRHLRALCTVGRHDDMGENLSCAACALTARIETHLDGVSGAESAQDGRTGLNVAHEPRQAPQGSQERSERPDESVTP